MLRRVLPLRSRASQASQAWRTWLAGTLVLASLTIAAPALATGLIVQSRTTFVPGVEFGWIRSTFFRLHDGEVKPDNTAIDRWTHHSIRTASAWESGVRVAEVLPLKRGSYLGRVSIYDPNGGLAASRPVRLTLDSGYLHVVTVLLTPEDPPQVAVLPAIELSHWTSEEIDVLGDSDVEETKDPIECPPNLAMTELACEGSFCDNVQITCKSFPGVSSVAHRFTPFFSDGDGYQGCSSNEFASGLTCQGDFCDNISLRCTEHTGTEDSCYTTDPISDGQPLIGVVPPNGYVRRIQCEGNYCDDKRLEICLLKEYPLHLGAFPGLCVSLVGGSFELASCDSAAQGGNIAQTWSLDDQMGQLVNPLTGTCLTALGGHGAVTEETCAEAGDTHWFMDGSGRLSSIDENNNPLCLTLVGVQDPTAPPPIGASFELGACSSALYQVFEPTNAGLPPPLPEIDFGSGEIIYLPALPGAGWLILAAALTAVGATAARRRV